ncbi:MAG: hypothetical protein QOE68_199 [Thermoanaerobaculia bacterium]|jgi:hypothetical protein|nr:hypothetical protein [Thermoanaerobaculia bacterium]
MSGFAPLRAFIIVSVEWIEDQTESTSCRP